MVPVAVKEVGGTCGWVAWATILLALAFVDGCLAGALVAWLLGLT